MLNIFRQKTAPAFEVALRLGAAFAGALTLCPTVYVGDSGEMVVLAHALGTFPVPVTIISGALSDQSVDALS